MMNPLKLTSAVLMLALAALASGCAADDELTGTTPDSGSKDRQMTITVATSTDATTRVAYDENKVGSAGVLTWEEGDKLTVVGFDESGSYQGKAEYTLSSEAGDTKGSFTGSEITNATKYNVYYPSTVTVDEAGAATFALSTQKQDGNNNTAHLHNNIFLQATDVTDLGNIGLDMKSSIMKFELSNVPQEVGTLKTLIWTVETADGFKNLELAFPTEGNVVTFSDGNQTLTSYLAFMSDDMSVKVNGKFSVTLRGDKAYYAETTIIDGKTYAENLRYTTKIDGSSGTMEWKEPITVQTTVASGSNYYNGFTMEIGSWKADAPAEQITLGSAIVADGAATIFADLSAYIGKDIWVCIPKVVKFFHTLTADEVNNKVLTLPDKDAGSILLKDNNYKAGDNYYKNDWIVALYVGINEDGSTDADATPLYWATGNLIATKTGSGDNDVAFHIATDTETKGETTTTDYQSYSNRSIGSQWDLFGWGDATGLKTSQNNGDYGPSGSANICGNASYDIARAQLGGSWHLFGRIEMESMYRLLASSGSWDNTVQIRSYTYTISNSSITNTLAFPAAGYREGTGVITHRAYGYYWNGARNFSNISQCLCIYFGDALETSFNRYCGISVRPVSE